MEPIDDRPFEISRVEAGISQLDTAIRLHFQMASEVATRTLAAAAAVLFQSLVDMKHHRMHLAHISGALDIRDKTYIDALQNAQWLLQYPRESSAHQRWSQSETELLLAAATLNIEELSVDLSAPQLVFKLWYFAKHQAALSRQASNTREEAIAAFAQLRELTDRQQRMAGMQQIDTEEWGRDRGTRKG